MLFECPAREFYSKSSVTEYVSGRKRRYKRWHGTLAVTAAKEREVDADDILY